MSELARKLNTIQTMVRECLELAGGGGGGQAAPPKQVRNPDEPASEKQKSALAAMLKKARAEGKATAEAVGKIVTEAKAGITKGRASELIQATKEVLDRDSAPQSGPYDDTPHPASDAFGGEQPADSGSIFDGI